MYYKSPFELFIMRFSKLVKMYLSERAPSKSRVCNNRNSWKRRYEGYFKSFASLVKKKSTDGPQITKTLFSKLRLSSSKLLNHIIKILLQKFLKNFLKTPGFSFQEKISHGFFSKFLHDTTVLPRSRVEQEMHENRRVRGLESTPHNWVHPDWKTETSLLVLGYSCQYLLL